MKVFKRIVKSSVVLGYILSSCPVLAQDFVAKLTGGFDFQAGYLKANDHKNLTQNMKNRAFYSTAYLAANVSSKLDSGFLYGAKIAITTTSRSSRKLQSGLFFENAGGRLELGSDKSAMTKMRISPFSIAAATAGMWDVWATSDILGGMPIVMNYGCFLDQKMRVAGESEYSRKITYYTPTFYGFQIGVSYVPDSSNVGYSTLSHTPTHGGGPAANNYSYSIKNGFSGGITYKKSIEDDFGIKLSAVGEMGKGKAAPKDDKAIAAINKANLPLNPRVKNLKNYMLGAQIDYGKFSIAGSYGNYMKSLSMPQDKNKTSNVYGIGGKYKFDKLSTSLAFISSGHGKNKLNATTLGADYKLAPGLLPYAEVTYFSISGFTRDPNSTKKSRKGTLAIIGTRVEF